MTHADPAQWLIDVNARYKMINAMADGADKEQARKALNDRGNRLAYEAIRRDLLRAVYSPAQLQGTDDLVLAQSLQRVRCKGQSALVVADYEERAIRPHALGHFRIW